MLGTKFGAEYANKLLMGNIEKEYYKLLGCLCLFDNMGAFKSVANPQFQLIADAFDAV